MSLKDILKESFLEGFSSSNITTRMLLITLVVTALCIYFCNLQAFMQKDFLF